MPAADGSFVRGAHGWPGLATSPRVKATAVRRAAIVIELVVCSHRVLTGEPMCGSAMLKCDFRRGSGFNP